MSHEVDHLQQIDVGGRVDAGTSSSVASDATFSGFRRLVLVARYWLNSGTIFVDERLTSRRFVAQHPNVGQVANRTNDIDSDSREIRLDEARPANEFRTLTNP